MKVDFDLYVKKQDVINQLHEQRIDNPLDSDRWVIDRCIQRVGKMPPADVIPVVRCADCKFCNTERTNYPGNDWDGSCDFWNTHSVSFSWFCSNGVRKEET